MPLKIPGIPVVLSFHRGADIKEREPLGTLTRQPKDGLEPRYQADPMTRPYPKNRGSLPSVSIARSSFFNALHDDRAVSNAARRRPVSVTRDTEVLGTVVTHIQAQLHRAAARLPKPFPPVMLLGSAGQGTTTLLAALSALSTTPAPGLGPTVLFEGSQQRAGQLADQARALDALLAFSPDTAHTRLLAGLQHADASARANARDLVLTLVTWHLGGSIGSCDPAHANARHLNEREHAMEGRIRQVASDAKGPVLVMVESPRLPKLHAGLDGEFDAIGMAVVDEATAHPQSSDERKRSSYLLSHPDVLTLHAGGPLDAAPVAGQAPVDVLAFIRGRLGVDLATPPSGDGPRLVD
jgi:hypothetical protein